MAKKKVETVKKYRVELKHVKQLEVEATSIDEAFEKFKAHYGILKSQWAPEITVVRPDQEEHGDKPTAATDN